MATTDTAIPSGSVTKSTIAEPAWVGERRFEQREPVLSDLWMIDHYGSTVLRCRCVEASPNGMRLRVPLGYGVAEGQRYELRSHLPGSRCATTLGLVGSRWATVVRTRLCIDDGTDHLDVGMVLDASDHPLTSVAN